MELSFVKVLKAKFRSLVMKIILRLIYFLIVFQTLSSKALAQKVTVSFDTQKGIITKEDMAKIPFDEPFNIEINDTSWSYAELKIQAIKPIFSQNGYFLFSVDPIRDRTTYQFSISGMKKIQNSKLIKELRDSIPEIVDRILIKGVAAEKSDMIKYEISEILKKYEIASLYNEHFKPINLDAVFSDTLIQGYFTRFKRYIDDKIKYQNILYTSNNSISNETLELFTKVQDNRILFKKLIKIKDSEVFKNFLSRTVNPYTEITNSQIIEILLYEMENTQFDYSQLFDYTGEIADQTRNYDQSMLFPLILGRAKIDGNKLQYIKSGYDISGIKLLNSFLNAIEVRLEQVNMVYYNKEVKILNEEKTKLEVDNKKIGNTRKKSLIKRKEDNTSRITEILKIIDNYKIESESSLSDLKKIIDSWLNYAEKYVTLIDEINQMKAKAPNILTKVYLGSFQKVEIIIIPEFTPNSNPYMGIDFGLLNSPQIGSTFLFQGLNFHLRPVNVNGSYNNFSKIDTWLKRLSINGGIAQRLGEYGDENIFQNAWSIGNPFVGIGFRANSFLRISYLVLWYGKKNANPIINMKEIKFTRFNISVSLDTQFKNIYKTVTTFF
jgi:hypothetical protein